MFTSFTAFLLLLKFWHRERERDPSQLTDKEERIKARKKRIEAEVAAKRAGQLDPTLAVKKKDIDRFCIQQPNKLVCVTFSFHSFQSRCEERESADH